MKKVLKIAIMVILTAGDTAVLAQVPHRFRSQTVASADSVNANFDYLMNQINGLKIKCDSIGILKSKIDSLNSTKSGFPIGTIIASVRKPLSGGYMPGDSSWKLADGTPTVSSIPYVSDYGNTGTPDLRGVFLRGLDPGGVTGKDPDGGSSRKAGNYQLDDFKSHDHGGGNHNHSISISPCTHSNNVYTGIALSGNGTRDGNCGDDNTVTRNSGNIITSNGGTETRPKNVAVYYYIKVK